MKFSLCILLMCLFICPVLFESCRGSTPSPFPYVVTSGFEGEYIISYGQSYMDSRCSSEGQTFTISQGICSFTVSSSDDNKIKIIGNGCEWWPWPDMIKYILGKFDTDDSFRAGSGIECFVCCCDFEISGRFYSDKTIKGEVYINFSHDKNCGIIIPIQGMRTDMAQYEWPESDNECIGDSDCLTSGCSGEICSTESMPSPCFANPPPAGTTCGCVSGRCKWHYF